MLKKTALFSHDGFPNDVHRWSFLSFSRLTNYFRFWSGLFLWGPVEMIREELCEWKSNRWAHKWDLTFLKRPLILISLQILLIPTKSQLKCVNYYKGGFGGVSLYMKGYESQVWGDANKSGQIKIVLLSARTKNTKGPNPLGWSVPPSHRGRILI